MSTNATIAVRINPEVRHQIYLHWDGYPQHAGFILAKYYNTKELAEKLVSLGDLSVLAKNIEPSEGSSHSFENKEENICVYYGRDRNEEGTEFQVLPNHRDGEKQQYNYMFKNGQWYCNNKSMSYDASENKLYVDDLCFDNQYGI